MVIKTDKNIQNESLRVYGVYAEPRRTDKERRWLHRQNIVEHVTQPIRIRCRCRLTPPPLTTLITLAHPNKHQLD